MYVNSWNLQVLVNDRPVTEYFKDGKTFIEGRKNSEYKLSFYNPTYRKVKAVFSVDGLNILTGDTNFERGYIVDPYQTLVIPGWRKDADGVNKFIFENINRSYSARSGHGTMNVGVIGVKVFEERQQFYQWSTTYLTGTDDSVFGWNTSTGKPQGLVRASYTSDNLGGGALRSAGLSVNSIQADSTLGLQATASASGVAVGNLDAASSVVNVGYMAVQPAPEKVGTGYGEHKEFKTQTVSFDANSWTSAVILLYYDSYENLKNLGIIPPPSVASINLPNAFPSDGCPPPKW